jgi:hypothetical protein
MLDMGGAPSAANDNKTLIRTINASKNSKVQAVAFDFEVLVCDAAAAVSSPENNGDDSAITRLQGGGGGGRGNDEDKLLSTPLQPDIAKINEVASLLNIKMDMGIKSDDKLTTVHTVGVKNKPTGSNPLLDNDVRSRYADKLKKVGIGGGIQAVDHAKSQVEDTLQRGDAAGHLVARQVAIDQDIDNRLAGAGGSKKGSKWMAAAGVGRLLSYLTHRSISIALLPASPATSVGMDDDEICPQEESMQDLAHQLKKDVIVDIIVPRTKEDTEDSYMASKRSLQKNVLDVLGIQPKKVLLVTNKDFYLKAGRDLGMLTCRLQPKNSRRGNITTHYTVPSAVEVRDVVDEINGISFNAVLNR